MKKGILCLLLIGCVMLSACGTADWCVENEDTYYTDADIAELGLQEPAFLLGDTVFCLGSVSIQDIINAGAVSYDKNIDNSESDVSIVFEYDGCELTVFAEDRTDEDAAEINDYTVYQIYFAEGDIQISGGVSVGDTLSSIIDVYGDPFSYAEGEDISEDYEGITAYYFTAAFNDDVVCAFVDNDTETVLSLRISEATGYVDDLDTILDDFVYEWIDDFMADWECDTIADVDGSDQAAFTIETISWTQISLYTISDCQPSTSVNSVVVVELEAVASFSSSERNKLYLQQKINLESEYDVCGCFYIVNIATSDTEGFSGTLQSTLCVYEDRDYMLYDIFEDNIEDYSVQTRTLVYQE